MLIISSYALIITGMFLILTSFIGMLRFKDFNSKIHASSILETLGVGLVLFGLALMQSNFFNGLKIILIILFLWILAPVATNLIAKAYYIKHKK